jgi:TolB protein
MITKVTSLLGSWVVLLGAWQASAADLEISIPIQLTHAQNFDPAPSLDGKKLVFVSMLSGKEQLFTMDADGKNIAQLTRDDADHEDPAWSPDRKKIAFVLITNERTSIAVMNADGSNVEVLTPKEHNTIHPNWSADSKQVIYCTNDDLAPPKKNEAQINVVDLATKKITPLITGGINTYGSWSADMKRIAFRKIIGEENSEVFVANADGSNLRNLTNNPFFGGWPEWSPDGRKIAFASNRRSHGYQIFVMDADGANVRLIANTEGRGTAPRWSPNGKTIYFTNCVEKERTARF